MESEIKEDEASPAPQAAMVHLTSNEYHLLKSAVEAETERLEDARADAECLGDVSLVESCDRELIRHRAFLSRGVSIEAAIYSPTNQAVFLGSGHGGGRQTDDPLQEIRRRLRDLKKASGRIPPVLACTDSFADAVWSYAERAGLVEAPAAGEQAPATIYASRTGFLCVGEIEGAQIIAVEKEICDDCTYLGQSGEYDLYHCLQVGAPTAIARYGNEGADCATLPYFHKDSPLPPDYETGPALKEAWRRADQVGLPADRSGQRY
ncbi:MAG: hypothetical protein RIF32_02320 [Leptospirales bacterium]